jgi:hypothetical protein
VAALPPQAPRDPLSAPVLPILRNLQAALQKVTSA